MGALIILLVLCLVLCLLFAVFTGELLEEKKVSEAFGFLVLSTVCLVGVVVCSLNLGKGNPITDTGSMKLADNTRYVTLGSIPIPSGGGDVYVVVRDERNNDYLYRLKEVPPSVFTKSRHGEYIPGLTSNSIEK